MKKKKVILAILICFFWFISPGIVSAGPANDPNVSNESQEQKFANIPSKDNGDGTCTWDINTVHFDTLFANSCNFAKEDLIEIYNGDFGFTDEYVTQFNNDCKKKIVYSLFENKSLKNGNKRHAIGITRYKLEGNQLTLYNDYTEYINGINEEKTLEKTCSINFAEANDKDVKEIKKAKDSLKNTYQLSGLDSFNAVYHYGPIMDPNGFYTDNVVYKFSEFKDSLMKYKKINYDVEFSAGGGTRPWDANALGWVHLSKNGITYDIKLVSFHMDLRLMVDKDLEGTPYEKAENRLKEYFGGKVNVEVDKVNVEEGPGLEGPRTHVTIGDYTSVIVIIEVEKEELDKYEVVAFDTDTDVKVESNSYEVPIDATINVKDVTGDVSDVFDKKMFKVHGAYDIDVVKLTDGGFVKVIENGIDVYLPVTDRKIGEEVTVYHITDNGKGDGYKGIVVEADDKQYVKFRTTHFSTYAVIEDVKDEVGNASNNNSTDIENPNTGDNLINSVVMLVISLMILVGCLVISLNKKHMIKE